MTILLLSGSPSFPSRSTRLLNYVGEQLNAIGHRTSRLQVRDLPAQALFRADVQDPELIAAKQQLADADAVIIATPVYKAAYSGLLKSFLDILPQDGLQGKVVLPLATGGSQSHMLMLDYALRPVLASLAAKQILPSIYATDQQIAYVDEHSISLEVNLSQRIASGVRHLAESLLFLREQQSEFPEKRSLACRI